MQFLKRWLKGKPIQICNDPRTVYLESADYSPSNHVEIINTIVHDDVSGFMKSFVASGARIPLCIERVNRQGIC